MSETVDSEVGRFYLTEVELVLLDRTLQSGVSVCLLTLFPGNRSKDFSETWSEVKGG